MIKRVRAARVLLLLAMMAAGLLVWQKAGGWYNRFMQQTAQDEIARTVPQMEAGAAFYLALDRPTGQDGALPAFGLWRLPIAEDIASSGEDAIMNTNEQPEMAQAGAAKEEDFYLLFVPGAARRAGLRVQFEGELSLDGQPLASGQLLELAEGEHLLETPAGRWPFAAVYGSDLPCLFIEMSSGSLDAIHAHKGTMDLAYAALIQADGRAEYLGSIWMRGRGNITWAGVAEKRSYQINLEESAGLLGMSAARRWLLLANAFDGSLLRNQAAFAMAQAVGMPYTPNSQQIELYVQGEYRGCYLLCEKVEVDDSRVNIPDMDEMNQAAVRGIGAGWEKPLELYGEGAFLEPGYRRYAQLAAEAAPGSGGYLFEMDILDRFAWDGNPGFVTRAGIGISIKSPSSATRQQVEYLAELYQRLEDLTDPSNGDIPPGALSGLIDLHSFAQKYLLEEIVKNFDANMTSQFFYKLPDVMSTKLFAGPAWDYDFAFGRPAEDGFANKDMFDGPEGFWANQDVRDRFFWAGLYRDPDFRQEVYQCFWQEYVPVIDRMLENGWFGQQEQHLNASACMDIYRWQDGPCDPKETAEEYLKETRSLEAFLEKRMAFLKEEWKGEIPAQ